MNARHRDASTDTRTDLDAEGPLRRWARRKREVVREKESEHEARRRDERRDASESADEDRQAADDASAPVVVEEKVLTDEDMPALDSLDEDSDYSGFLSPGVSEALRRRALRKLFSSTVFNIPDGLDDYDDDFTSFAALGDIVTSDMKHQAEMEAERAKRTQAGAEPATGAGEEARGAEEERAAPEPAGDDAMARAEAVPAEGVEPSEPAALADPVPPDPVPPDSIPPDSIPPDSVPQEPVPSDAAPPSPVLSGAVTEEDAAGNGEPAASPAETGFGTRASVAGAGSPVDTPAPDGVGSTGGASDEASGGGAPATSAGDSDNECPASAVGEVSAKTGKAGLRGA